jgi:hypothetical protein
VSYVACPAVLYFSTLPHKRHDFRKIKLLNIKCMFGFPLLLLLEACIILSRTEQDMIENVYWAFCKLPVILVRFIETWFFSRQIFEKCSNIRFHENPYSGSWIVPCGQTDTRTDITKLIVALRNLVNAPSNGLLYSLYLHVFDFSSFQIFEQMPHCNET